MDDDDDSRKRREAMLSNAGDGTGRESLGCKDTNDDEDEDVGDGEEKQQDEEKDGDDGADGWGNHGWCQKVERGTTTLLRTKPSDEPTQEVNRPQPEGAAPAPAPASSSLNAERARDSKVSLAVLSTLRCTAPSSTRLDST